jgi:hypothetical protein
VADVVAVRSEKETSTFRSGSFLVPFVRPSRPSSAAFSSRFPSIPRFDGRYTDQLSFSTVVSPIFFVRCFSSLRLFPPFFLPFYAFLSLLFGSTSLT